MNKIKLIAAAAAAGLLAGPLLAQNPPVALPAAPSPAPPEAVGVVNDTALFLAGLMPSSDPAVVAMTSETAWQQHSKYFDTAWKKLEMTQLSKVRDWAKNHIAEAHAANDTAFYMFSGPDFLYADTFFPRANTYVLCGIEPVGPLPEISKLPPGALPGELRALQESLNSVMSFSFFITKDMKNDFQNHALSGTLPILYIFLARSGKTICDVSYVSLDEAGNLSPRQDAIRSAKSPAPGVRIHFLSEGSKQPQTMYYFSTDISDSGLKHSGFLKFCKSLAPGNSCVKSASYLMHESYFSTVRKFLLDASTTLVQDDSGIPCSFFALDSWQMRFFGSYPGPITLFKTCYQPQLAEYYRTSNPTPLDFGIGYRHHARESTLMVANRKPVDNSPPPVQPAAPEPPRAVLVPEHESAAR